MKTGTRTQAPKSTGSKTPARQVSRGSKAAPAKKGKPAQNGKPAGKADRSSVSQDARGPQAKNPVNFESWSGGLLKSGASGGQVATMQKALNEKLGGNIAVDGKFGKETQAALEKFQRSQKLDADGKAGDKTREALMGQAGAPKQAQRVTPNGEAQKADPAAKVAGPAKVDGQPKSGFGEKLARDAKRIAESGVAGSGHNCKRGVRMAFEKNGMSLSGVSAYMAADQLAKNKNFTEAKGLSRQDLKDLPPGATVVWNRGKGHPHGHISIAQGNGREASDVMRNQIVNYPSSYRVFMPN
ncbi:MAG: peptidoglycan-binding protein [Candidatus Eremiobacteraeota bacterium]|nr:peptidoglycan-binding protein [Candidatus Eremiobacteraeota bacterium]